MSDMNVTAATSAYGTYKTEAATSTESAKTASKVEDVKTAEANTAEAAGVVYEKSEDKKNGLYSINKMSPEDRAALVSQLKAEQDKRKSQLTELVLKMMNGQTTAAAKAGDEDSMWKFLASGEFTVDPATKAQAQEDISEDGYWGVKQTSQRMFDFASALAGDDVDKMKEMQEAMEKGFKMAEETWGRELPGISKDTMEATRKLFSDYFASKEVTE